MSQRKKVAATFTQVIDSAWNVRADAINWSAVRSDFTILFTRLIKMVFSAAKWAWVVSEKKATETDGGWRRKLITRQVKRQQNTLIEIHFAPKYRSRWIISEKAQNFHLHGKETLPHNYTNIYFGHDWDFFLQNSHSCVAFSFSVAKPNFA